MAYDPTNNPYAPGDPYSYDLKWIVKKIKDLFTSVSAAQSAADDASDAASAAQNRADNAYDLADDANTAANTAAEAAAALVTTQVVINCDTGAGTAEIDTDLTWDELIEAAQRGKLLCQLKLSNEIDSTKRAFCYPKISSFGGMYTMQISDISADGGDVPITRINADKAYFVNSKTGYYQHAYSTV